jgi:CheY-like chemotaxis protein
MDGLTSLRHIRAEEASGALNHNLVIALSKRDQECPSPKVRLTATAGNARQGQIDEAKAAGMDEVVIKPYRLDDLLHKIEEMMRLRAEAVTPVAMMVDQGPKQEEDMVVDK